MNGFLIVCVFVSFAAVNADYDVSGCENFIKAFISAGCEHSSKVDDCNKCVSDGLTGGDVSGCKSHVPDKFHPCFELGPLLQKIKITDVGAEAHRCMSVDICSKLGEYAEQIPEYAKQAAEQAKSASNDVKVADECKSEGDEHAKRAQEASQKLQDMVMSQAKKNGQKMIACFLDTLKTFFSLDDKHIDDMTTCGTSACS